MARRNDHSREELKELALSAAEKLVDEYGTHALSARKIAAEIGYSAGTLYLVFNNLDDLCWHVNARTMHRLNSLFANDPVINDPASAPAQVLRQVGLVYLRFANDNPNRWTLMFEHSTPDDVECPDWLTMAIDQLFEYVKAPLKQLQPQADETQLQLGIRTLWCSVHGIAALNLRGKLFLPATTRADELLDNLLAHYLKGWIQE